MRFLIALLLLSTLSDIGHTENRFDHASWDALLQQHVYTSNNGQSTVVDYRGMLQEKKQLKHYLIRLKAIDQQSFDNWPKDDQLAFLINAYNAWTVWLIIENYPLQSIRQLGNILRSPWKRRFADLLGKTRSLDDIEHNLIRGSGRYNEPRIHFAVNCASIGCPALRREAYRGDSLGAQLEQQTRLFLSDHSRNYLDNESLFVSKIFDWYRDDFEKGWQGHHSLEDFLLHYADAMDLSNSTQQKLRQKNQRIGFTDYDWQLNDRPVP